MKKSNLILIAGGLAAGWLFASVGFAGELAYQPVNPNFGGSSFNATPLMNNANAQNELARSVAGQRRQLTGNGNRVTQRQQVDPYDHFEIRVQCAQGCRIDQAVHAIAVVEADVICGKHVIDATIEDSSNQLLAVSVGSGQEFGRRKRAYCYRWVNRRWAARGGGHS